METLDVNEMPNSGLDSALDAAFDNSADTATADNPVEASSGNDAGELIDAGAATVQEQSGDGEQATDQQAEPAVPGEDGITPEGKGYRVAAPRLKNLQAAEQFYNGVSEFASDVETARYHYDAASDFGHLQSDLQNLPYDPEAVSRTLNFLDGSDAPDTQTQQALRNSFVRLAMEIPQRLAKYSPQAFAHFGSQFMNPGFLRQANPQAFQGIQKQMLQEFCDSMYQAAKASNGKDVNSLRAAQWIDAKLNGRHVPDNELDRIQAADPLAMRNAELERRERDITERTQAAQQQQERQYTVNWQTANARIEANKTAKVGDIIGEQLKAAQGKFSERQMAAFKNDLSNAVRQSLSGDPTWMRDYNTELRNIRIEAINRWRAGINDISDLNQRIQGLVDRHGQAARRVIAREAPGLISAATKDHVSANAAQHTRSQQAQQRRGTAGGGMPGKQPNARELAGKSWDEMFDAAFK